MGGRKMPVIPVAISLYVSHMSAILILGTPAEMYVQGTEWYEGGYGIALGYLFAGLFFVPLLYPLGLTSAFEYLELRFHSKAVRLLGMSIMILSQIIYLGIASYAPATALNAVTGIPVWVTLLTAGLITTFYTTIGGFKAVVWTDVFQAILMLGGVIAILIQGLLKVGGFIPMWDINQKWDRIHFFTIDFDPRVRHTLFSCVIGISLKSMSTAGFTQSSVQRYCSLSSLRQAQASVLLNIGVVIITYTLLWPLGMVMFAYYAGQDCDPLGQGVVDNQNQLLPYFVMDILAYPAVPGLFMASLFSGALSSMSSSMNSMAANVWEDAFKPWIGHRLTEHQRTFVIKIMVAVFGILSIGVSYAQVYVDGTVVQAAIALISPTNGAIAGMFLLGALFPFANKYGAFVGGVLGLAVAGWQTTGSYLTGISNFYLDLPSPNGTCSPNNTGYMEDYITPIVTSSSNTTESGDALYNFYSLSYLWLTAIALIVCIVSGLITSLLTYRLIPRKDRIVSTRLQIPIFSRMCCCLPPSWLYYLNCCRVFDKSSVDSSDQFILSDDYGDDEINKDYTNAVYMKEPTYRSTPFDQVL